MNHTKKIARLLIVTLYMISHVAISQIVLGVAYAETATEVSGFDHSHAAFTAVLDEYVSLHGPARSSVDYKRLKQNPAALERYLATLSAITPAQYARFSETQKIAFLVNAYNAFTLKLIIDHYPVQSIKDIGGLFGSPWKREFVPLLGEITTLNDIEHEILRKDFEEPRIHFALVCAAKGCPRLRNEAYRAAELEEQLEDSARAFLRDRTRNRYDPTKQRLYLSKIFDWFGSDFKQKYGSVRAYVGPRISSDPAVQEQVRSGDIRVKYTKYDWSLNEKE